MASKWKILGIKTNIEWFDVKTKFKQLLRKITYSWIFQEIVCSIAIFYMNLVYYTSKKIIINEEVFLKLIAEKKPIIFTFWHNRLMMIPFGTKKARKLYPNLELMTLASKHGDGKLVGRVMEKLGLVSILGSSRDGRKKSRGIDTGSFKKIFDGLKKGNTLGITPDGPRGPNQKINGEVLNIAKISGSAILVSSYSSSRFKKLKTWDRFHFPLPFSTICFYCDKEPIYVDKNSDAEKMEEIKIELENRMNFAQEESQRIANF